MSTNRSLVKLSVGWGAFIKNGLSNVARGSSSALVALVLTPFLTRNMAPEAYGTWVLILQLGAYTGYLDLGIQTAVGRFVAFYTEKEDSRLRDEVVSTSLALLLVTMGIGLVAIAALSWLWPHLFRQAHGIVEARISLLLVGGSLALALPFGVFNAIFIGLQRNEIPAAITAANKLGTATALIVLVLNHSTLVAMAWSVLGINVLSYIFQYLVYRGVAPEIAIGPRNISSRAKKELIEYCFSLSIWSFATLLVTGLDTAIVGFVDFKSVAYYAVPATLITFILGLQNAVFGVLIPMSAVLEARSSGTELGRMLVSTSRYGVFLLLITGVPLLIWGQPILSLWVGKDYATHSVLILKVLVLANIIRLSAVPYAMLLIGTGQQRLVTVSPLVEGLSNLIVSLVAGFYMGAVGVAVGTFVGAAVGILCNLAYNMPRSVSIAVDRLTYVRDGLFRPAICLLPVFAVFVTQRLVPQWPSQKFGPVAMAAWTLVAFMFWRFGLLSNERTRILSFISGSIADLRGDS